MNQPDLPEPRPPVKHTMLRICVGVLFLILGILGLFLPILQGILFLVIGMALLADHIPPVKRLRDWLYRRYPKLEKHQNEMKIRWHQWCCARRERRSQTRRFTRGSGDNSASD